MYVFWPLSSAIRAVCFTFRITRKITSERSDQISRVSYTSSSRPPTLAAYGLHWGS